MKKRYYLLGLFIPILLLLLLLIPKKQTLEIEYPSDWTNETVEITVKKEKGALYSFQDGEYSTNNRYQVESNVKDLKIKMKIGKKELTKYITISNIDKESPTIESASLKDGTIEVVAKDELSGIKEYVYIIDGKEIVSKEHKLVLETKPTTIEIKVIDHANNESLIPNEYFQSDDIVYTLSEESWTNQDIILSILKKPNYLEYSFSYDEQNHYQKTPTFTVTKNGTITMKVKTKEKELTKQVIIDKIDKEAPIATYTLKNNTVTVTATDNSKETLLYSFSGEAFQEKNTKTYTKTAKNQNAKVKDKAGNITTLTFDVIMNSSQKPTEKPVEKPTETPKPEKPTFQVKLSETNKTKNPVVVTVVTDNDNLVSFQNGEWSTSKTVTITSNVENYSIRVKNKAGLISEQIIQITNIEKEKTQKEKNQEVIKQIQSTYGVKVSYGEGCFYAGGSCTPLSDDTKASKALSKLNTVFSRFPNNFFKAFQGNNGYRIILVERIPGGAQGVTSYEIGNDNQMYLDVNNEFMLERTVYHETWHFMEQLMTIKNGWNNPFTTWNDYNPTGFHYNTDTSNQYTPYDSNIYNPGYNKGNLAFISTYGKTSDREDRAEIFADLMFRGYKQSYMNAGYGINEKAKVMIKEIRKVWPNSVGATWEKYVTF